MYLDNEEERMLGASVCRSSLCLFTRDAITKDSRLGSFSGNDCLTALEAGITVSAGGFFLGSLSLICRWPLSLCVVTGSSLCVQASLVAVCVQISSSCKDTSQSGLGHTLMVSF